MTISVRITAYDRFDLLKECVFRIRESFNAFSRVWVDASFDIGVYADHNANSNKAVEIHELLGGWVPVIGTNSAAPLGADLNILRSMELAGLSAAIDQDTYVVKLDSDILVARNFLRDMVVLAKRFDGMATSNLYGRDPLETKIANRNNITRWAMSGANFCIRADHLERILPMATALIKTYKQNGHNPATTAEEWRVMKDLLRLYTPLHNPDNSPHRDFLLNSDVPNTGSDAMIAVAAWCHGIPIVSYTVNRAIHPSDTGVNTTREFSEQHYAGVTLDDLPPADPSQFKFV